MKINRYYVCDHCDYSFMIQQDRDAPLKKKCPACGKRKLYQDLAGQHSFVYQDCKTLGHQAERNTERMGKYALEDKRNKHKKIKKDKPKPWYNSEGVDLTKKLSHLDTETKRTNYVMGD